MPATFFVHLIRFLIIVLFLAAAVTPTPWAFVTLCYMTLGVFFLDALLSSDVEVNLGNAESKLTLWVQAIAHVFVLGATLWSVAFHAPIYPWASMFLILATGLYMGQVSNSLAHELIHKTSRQSVRVGRLIYSTLLFAHHATAHRFIHHPYVATDQDPSSAAYGQGFYNYLLGAWYQNLTRAYSIDRERCAKLGKSFLAVIVQDLALPMAIVIGLGVALGSTAVLAYLFICFYAQIQLMLSDYVQHYGLRRNLDDDGRLEPVGPQHSWDAPFWLSSTLMLNAPLHGHHHMRPQVSFENLKSPEKTGGPVLPYNLPTMCALALVPPVWRLIMGRRVDNLHEYMANPAD
ncbi:MAG: alkane 1-monooxygenase [Planktomarina sp.]